MPHLRDRYIKALLLKSSRYSAITGLFGHRQVGKTTLVSSLADKYLTLDNSWILDEALANPNSFVKKNSALPLVIDECQLAPPLFPVLKEWVRVHPKPGQFILTGSVRFSSRMAIRESLTGRMIAWELLPMNLSEAHNEPLANVVPRLTRSKTVAINLPSRPFTRESEIATYLEHGGLPGIFAVRDAAVRKQKLETQINTLLERDLKLVCETTLSYRSLVNLLEVLAQRQGQPVDLTAISRQARISVPTLRKLLAGLEAIFLIRIINTEGTEKRPVLFFEDQGEATSLASNRYDEITQMTRFLFSQIRHQWVYRPEVEGSVFQYRTRGGAHVPLCFRGKDGELGIIPILDENPNQSEMASARSFLAAYPNSKVIWVTRADHDQVASTRTRTVSISQVI